MNNDLTLPLPQPAAPTNRDLALASVLDSGRTPYYSSFSPDDQFARAAVFSALNGESRQVQEAINTPIQVWGFIVRASDPKIDSDGEVSVYPVTLLMCSGGEVYRSGSRGVLQALRMIESERGPGVWSPPEKVVIRSRSLGGNPPKNWIYLTRSSQQE